MKILLIINDAPYGSEKAYNALRLAMMTQKEHPEVAVQIFLMADAVNNPARLLQHRADAAFGDQQRRRSQSLRHLLRRSRYSWTSAH